jgi:hypothetical protein
MLARMAGEPPQAPPVQPWNTPVPASNARGLIYMAGVVVIALIVIIGVGIFALKGAYNIGPLRTAPSPRISDFDRANQFLDVDLAPSLAAANQALPAVTKDCTAQLPPQCKGSLITLNNAMLDVNDAIASNQRDIPPCIGREVQRFRDDWTAMEQGVAQAIGGYNAGSRAQVMQGLQRFADLGKLIKPDVDRINRARATCSKTV